MDFEVGQMVICVDASLPANPWHRANPLKWGGIYMVREINKHDPSMIRIDNSRRLWPQTRFRPLDRKTETDIAFAHEILRDAIKTPQPIGAGQSLR